MSTRTGNSLGCTEAQDNDGAQCCGGAVGDIGDGGDPSSSREGG